jgi:hypothetical protein
MNDDNREKLDYLLKYLLVGRTIKLLKFADRSTRN